MRKKNLKLITISAIVIITFLMSLFYKIYVHYKVIDGEEIVNLSDEDIKDKTIVDVWLKNDNASLSRQYQIEKFNQLHDDIYIKYKRYSHDYQNILKISTAIEEGPDIMTYGTFDQIRNNNLLYIENSNIDVKNYAEDSFVNYNGHIIGTRVNESNVKFTWNKEIFKKAGLDPEIPPRTWDELLWYCNKIKEYDENIVPFAFPITNYNEFKLSIGEASVNFGSIYTDFWDYKNGEFNFGYSYDILNFYKKLYDDNMLSENFYEKNSQELRDDFFVGNTAMMLTSYEDKWYYRNVIPLAFDVGIDNIPKFQLTDSENYYFLSNSNFLCINNSFLDKELKEKEAIVEVYEWMISLDTNKDLYRLSTLVSPLVRNVYMKEENLDGYNSAENFTSEIYDPGLFMSRDAAKTIQLSIEAITGNKTLEETVEELNLIYKDAYDLTNRYNNVDFNYYIENSIDKEN